MPEGDTVFRTARSLHAALAGRVLRRTDLRVPGLAGADLAGQQVLEVRSRGKHLLLRTDGGWTLRTHLRMEGSWRLHRPGERFRGGPGYEIRAVLETDEWVAVGFRLGMVDLVPTTQEDRLVGHLGPDLLGSDWDPEEARRRLLARPDREIGDALLDQSNLAGLGTLYRSEVLFLRGVSPFTGVGSVEDLPALLGLARRLLDFGAREGVQSTTGRRSARDRHWVFERPGQPCRRCGALVQVARQGEDPTRKRLVYWCPSCQPAPG